MANLKSNLDEYLLQNDSRRGFRWGIPEGWRPSWSSQSTASTPSTSTRDESRNDGWFSNIKCDCFPALSRVQRLIGFCTCVGLGILCFILSFLFIPTFNPRKFALLFTFGSCFFIMSASFLYGPMNHLKSLFSKERIIATLLYWGTLAATLFSALHLQSTLLTILFAVLQIIVLVWITLGVVPGGTSGVRAFGSMFKSSVSNTLPI